MQKYVGGVMKKYIIFVLSCLITSHLSLHIHADDTDSNSYQTSETGWKIEEKLDSYTLSCPLEYVDDNVFEADSFEIQKDKNPNDIQRFINHIEAFNEYRSEFLQRQISQDQSLILPLTAAAYALSQLNIFDAIYFNPKYNGNQLLAYGMDASGRNGTGSYLCRFI